MRALDRTILMRHSATPGRQRVHHHDGVGVGVGAEIADRRRKAVASVLLGNPAQRPQGVLQPFRQRDKALATEHDMGVFEAGKRQTEVIEPAVQQLAGDGDPRPR